MKVHGGIILAGLILVPYFLGKLYFGKANPLRLSGWLWFIGFLLSLCVFGYGVALLLYRLQDGL